MKEIKIASISDLTSIISRKHYRKWIYRGQSDSSWELESSLHRAFEYAEYLHSFGKTKTKFNRQKHEAVMIDKFKCNSHLYLDHLPKEEDTLSWVSLMQHHGAPTRLLDFTFSPYVALYFALELGRNDAAIYCLNYDKLKAEDTIYFNGDLSVANSNIAQLKDADDLHLLAFEPRFSNKRLLAQQGLFVAPSTLAVSHEKIISEYNLPENDFLKIIIPAKLRYTGLRQLSHMNINSSNIYPGLDGYCQSMRNQPVFGVAWQARLE
jgi:hypothetical protein